MNPAIEIVVALPSDYVRLRSVIETKLREEWRDAQITFEESEASDCYIKSVTVPKAQSITDVQTGEEVSGKATLHAAQQIVSSVCNDADEGKP